MLEVEELTNLNKIEYGSTEDYDPDTSDLVVILDGRGFKDWAGNPRSFLRPVLDQQTEERLFTIQWVDALSGEPIIRRIGYGD